MTPKTEASVATVVPFVVFSKLVISASIDYKIVNNVSFVAQSKAIHMQLFSIALLTLIVVEAIVFLLFMAVFRSTFSFDRMSRVGVTEAGSRTVLSSLVHPKRRISTKRTARRVKHT